ncbi:MAG: hypothetical protein R2784_16635 [Saprospiraceae bacterium]
MGQDIAEYGGVFKLRMDLLKSLEKRGRNTPLCESAIIGAGLGLSLEGYKSWLKCSLLIFVSCGFNKS